MTIGTECTFLESNGHGSLINSSSRKQCFSTRNIDIDLQVQIWFVRSYRNQCKNRNFPYSYARGNFK